MYVADADLSSAYPSGTIVYNISKSTQVLFVFELELLEDNKRTSFPYKTTEFFELFMVYEENAVRILHEYFGLYNYTDLLEL
jgi:hypothetical protein